MESKANKPLPITFARHFGDPEPERRESVRVRLRVVGPAQMRRLSPTEISIGATPEVQAVQPASSSTTNEAVSPNGSEPVALPTSAKTEI